MIPISAPAIANALAPPSRPLKQQSRRRALWGEPTALPCPPYSAVKALLGCRTDKAGATLPQSDKRKYTSSTAVLEATPASIWVRLARLNLGCRSIVNVSAWGADSAISL